MDFYTIVLRRTNEYWVALCLENGLVGQEETKEGAIEKLKEAIDSFEFLRRIEKDIYNAPVAIKELHEFLTVEDVKPLSEQFELRAIYA
ncbi:MAG: type II toxin-antitoxin system HicB family antitoxin [bacterium]|nr:type II toxin-antitoxin system HicB family antitoxin [bacterium]